MKCGQQIDEAPSHVISQVTDVAEQSGELPADKMVGLSQILLHLTVSRLARRPKWRHLTPFYESF
jgi:hypothetical protein